MAGNKSDLVEKEEVKEEEAKNFAKEIGAIFRMTSAFLSYGIEDLFRTIGCKILNPNYKDGEYSNGNPVKVGTNGNKKENPEKDEVNTKGVKLKLDKDKNNTKKKKKFC